MYLEIENRVTFNKFYLSFITFVTFSIVALFLLYLYAFNISNDAIRYEILWNEIRHLSLKDILGVERDTSIAHSRIEPLSLVIFWLFTQFSNAITTFYLFGALALTIKIYLLKKYTRYSLIAIFFYILLFSWALEANAIRAAMAACVVIYALLCDSSKQRYFFYSLIAILFHYSGIILASLYLLKITRKPSVVVILGITGVLVLSFIWDFIMTYIGLNTYLSYLTGNVNIFSSVAICHYGIVVASILNWKNLTERQQRGAYFIMIGAVFYIAFLDNAVIAHRMRELSLLGLLPLLFLSYRKFNYRMLICYLLSAYIAGYAAFDTLVRFF